MRNGMAMCRADGSSNVIYLGIRYQENKNQSLPLLWMELEKNR